MTDAPPRPVVVLVDDVRSFRDRRPCQVARTSTEAVVLLESLRGTRIDELWLDHDLGGDDTVWPVVRLVEDAALAGAPFDIGTVQVHAARAGAAHRVVISMRRAGYEAHRFSRPAFWIHDRAATP